MKRIICFLVVVSFMFTSMVFGQAASKGTAGQSLKQFSQESKEKTQEQEGRIADFILSVIGGL